MTKKLGGLIDLFITHRVAANLLMLIMLLAGVWSLWRLNTQFLPTFDVNFVTIDVKWPGASAEDVERSITTPLEKELRNVDDMKEMKSISREGFSQIIMEFNQGADMGNALDNVKEQVALVRDLPPDSEEPIIKRRLNFEPVAKILVVSPGSLDELRPLVYSMERQLLDSGIAKVTITGLPDQEIAIQIPSARLAELQLSLDQIAERVRARSQDIPAGRVGRAEVGRQLRSLEQRRDEKSVAELPIIHDESGRILRLGDIATIKRRARDQQVTMIYRGRPAVELQLFRAEDASALKSAKIFHQWLDKIRPQLPPGVKIRVFDERWQYIKQRIDLLVKNGIGGFLLILIVLFLFLNRRVAFWVAMGIPISIMAAMAALYAVGGSINMVSLFAFIMTLGIIVDDTIVVGEETLTQMQAGKPVLESVRIGAHRMMPPIFASSLTTISAFIPLMLVSDIIGTILLDIPLVVICVITASLLECFLVLPGHLYHSYRRSGLHGKVEDHKRHPIRSRIDAAFNRFKYGLYCEAVTIATKYHWITISFALAMFLLSIGLVFSGRLNFTFFPAPDSAILRANVQFTAGTSPTQVQAFIGKVDKALQQTNERFSKPNEPVVLTAVTVLKQLATERLEDSNGKGDEYAHILVELTQPDDRDVSNNKFITAWRKRITLPPNVENFTITEPRAGPPGRDIDVRLTAHSASALKSAALTLAAALKTYSGTSQIQDNLPFGQQQLIYELTPRGKALGLTINNVGQQLHAAFNGRIVQVFYEGNDEIEVRVMLPDEERHSVQALELLPIVTPGGETVPLENVLKLRVQRGLNIIRHTNTELTANVTAEVDPSIANANKIIASLNQKTIPDIIAKYGVKTSFEGRAEEQAETLQDMKVGMFLALTLIYIILAWVFSSYGLPILIMLTIPLGLTGAILGHLIMGIDLTILSLFGFFGLSGIVINDSIILVNRYLYLRKQKMPMKKAVVEASCQRFRAVLLTSLTTIAGLTPLLFETSIQAQFLIPMAVSISFGLAYATVLVLFVVPSFISIYEHLPFRRKLQHHEIT